MELVHSELCIPWVLMDVDPASLERLPPHLCIESKEPEAGVPGKSSIFIHQQMLEIVSNGDLVAALSKEVCGSGW